MIYRGLMHSEKAGGQLVTRDDDILSPVPSQKLFNHSPTGFNWGYGGSGPAQLALALLLDVTKDTELSVRLHQSFKWQFVAKWEGDWVISSDEILSWINTTLEIRDVIRSWLESLSEEVRIEKLKRLYVGKRLEVVNMPEDPDPIKPGEQGICEDVDGAGQLMVKWDNGRNLSLIPGVDEFKVVEGGNRENKSPVDG